MKSTTKKPKKKVPTKKTRAQQSVLARALSDSYAKMWYSSVPTIYQLGGTISEPSKAKPPTVDRKHLKLLEAATPYRVTQRMPDFVQVITGWRAWDVKPTKEGWRLAALGTSYNWPAKKVFEAVCAKDNKIWLSLSSFGEKENSTHPAPQSDCDCGIWAFKELDSLVKALGNKYDKVRVLGKVSLWGRVVETENGYRAEKAYPAELWLFDSSLEELGLIYDVPVRTL